MEYQAGCIIETLTKKYDFMRQKCFVHIMMDPVILMLFFDDKEIAKNGKYLAHEEAKE